MTALETAHESHTAKSDLAGDGALWITLLGAGHSDGERLFVPQGIFLLLFFILAQQWTLRHRRNRPETRMQYVNSPQLDGTVLIYSVL